jgi:hypothetical protein
MGVIYCMAHGKKRGRYHKYHPGYFVFFACLYILGLHCRRRQAIYFPMPRALIDGVTAGSMQWSRCLKFKD